LEKKTGALEKFYTSVQSEPAGSIMPRASSGSFNELYDKFFETAFPRMADRLGIVYTPVEVRGFMIRSVDYALRQEFGTGLGGGGIVANHGIDIGKLQGGILINNLFRRRAVLESVHDGVKGHPRVIHIDDIVIRDPQGDRLSRFVGN
jgi:predicted helicase